MKTNAAQAILEKLAALPPERLAQVEDFVDFLRTRVAGRAPVTAVAKCSEKALAKVQENEDDGDYDRL